MSIAERYRPHYTYDDYCQWEGRWELIEGMPYAMSPLPVPEHQNVSGNLYTLFKESLSKNCRKCKAYLPLDWKVSDDTIVQPDVLIVCKKIEKKYLDFPPALVIEVLSPATAAKDRGEKMELYQSQKIKYYLIVDAQFKKIEIYELLNYKYEPVSINPELFDFNLEEGCSAKVNFKEAWE
jgi:Uma2 family endonuclease